MNPVQVPSVDVAELSEEAVLLDVREDDEWVAGHIRGAVHVPMGQVPDRLDELPADQRLHVLCRSGGRSAKVTAYLNAAGRDAVNVDGGMQAWAAAGRRMVTEIDGVAPQVR